MVTKKPKGLGRGLDALLGPSLAGDAGEGAPAATPAGTPMMLSLDALAPGQYQPRTRMDEGALYELAESIKSQGIMQPILVRRLKQKPALAQDGQAPAAIFLEANYEIIAGERRFRAARLAGLAEVPVLLRDVPDEAAAAMA
ncbi:MAG TPA: ParB/RepB/Spo0J family partition protein, partial [Ottowia sp.]|nr:ParB/RepB/Spo0J family partition protein [Ottowia sp.]